MKGVIMRGAMLIVAGRQAGRQGGSVRRLSPRVGSAADPNNNPAGKARPVEPPACDRTNAMADDRREMIGSHA